MIDVDAIPVELRERAQWVVWKREPRKGGKSTKVPYRAYDPRTKAACDNPRTWATFERAIAVPSADAQGSGYVFSADDPFVGVDLDACIDAQGNLHPAAAEILTELGGYQERSPSDTGVHAIVAGRLNGDRHRTSETPWGGVFEIYDQGRFFTVTGKGSGEIVERQAEIDDLVVRMLGEPSTNGAGPTSEEETGDAGPGRAVEELIEAFPRLGEIVKHDGARPSDPSDSGWDHYLGCESVRCGLARSEFAALLRRARKDDAKSRREDYVNRTWAKAEAAVAAEERDPAKRMSARWRLGDDPVVSGEMRDPIVYLTRRSGRVLRLPNIDDLFEPNKHTRIVSRIAKTRFPLLTIAEAVDIAQRVIELCPSEAPDPLEEARQWVVEFIAHIGAVIEAVTPDGTSRPRWEILDEFEQAERKLASARSAAARTAIIRTANGELCLPAGALKEHSGARMSWAEFTACLAEIGWRHLTIDVREPTTRAGKAEARRVHRNFYAGTD